MFRLVSLISGLLFGLGMAVSGMVDPANVVGFLDVAGEWSPDLMFVMGGALTVFLPAYLLLIKPRSKPVLAEEFCMTKKSEIDTRLVVGATTFGIGWGLVGLCPGPVVSSLAAGNAGIVIFFSTMMVGLGLANILICINKKKHSEPQTVSGN